MTMLAFLILICYNHSDSFPVFTHLFSDDPAMPILAWNTPPLPNLPA